MDEFEFQATAMVMRMIEKVNAGASRCEAASDLITEIANAIRAEADDSEGPTPTMQRGKELHQQLLRKRSGPASAD